MTINTTSPLFISEKELAAQLGCTEAALRRRRRTQAIPPHTYVKAGRTVSYVLAHFGDVVKGLQK